MEEDNKIHEENIESDEDEKNIILNNYKIMEELYPKIPMRRITKEMKLIEMKRIYTIQYNRIAKLEQSSRVLPAMVSNKCACETCRKYECPKCRIPNTKWINPPFKICCECVKLSPNLNDKQKLDINEYRQWIYSKKLITKEKCECCDDICPTCENHKIISIKQNISICCQCHCQ